ncbi:MAG TPA: hypothetical protein VHW66_12100 [Stellaceae bacterium]|nr:hypothetical protein [Stellaceae bacterium]
MATAGLLRLGRPAGARTGANLLTAPLSLGGEWPSAAGDTALRVTTRMREACLSGIRLLSDRQPRRLRVDEHSTGPPSVWRHTGDPDMAVVNVDMPPRDWPRLAYQFGHELGHVLCNSWDWGAKPRLPCQWLEESMVEALSLASLPLLAAGGERVPLVPGDTDFPATIRKYRAFLLGRYVQAGGGIEAGAPLAGWFRATRAALEQNNGLAKFEGPMIVTIVGLLEHDRGYIEDYGALNRWPGRSAVPLEEYLRLWQASCGEIRSPGRLPARLKEALGLA